MHSAQHRDGGLVVAPGSRGVRTPFPNVRVCCVLAVLGCLKKNGFGLISTSRFPVISTVAHCSLTSTNSHDETDSQIWLLSGSVFLDGDGSSRCIEAEIAGVLGVL